jgi:hypothetical protein
MRLHPDRAPRPASPAIHFRKALHSDAGAFHRVFPRLWRVGYIREDLIDIAPAVQYRIAEERVEIVT